MENASKALIIAGAILISIVLITLGVLILGQGQEVANNSNMDDFSIQQFNKKFTQYCGNKVSGDKINVLIDAVITNNIVAARDGQSASQIKLEFGDKEISNNAGPLEIKSWKNLTKAQTAKVYKAEVSYANTGYLEKIKISAINNNN